MPPHRTSCSSTATSLPAVAGVIPAEHLEQREQRVDAKNRIDDLEGNRGNPGEQCIRQISTNTEGGARQGADGQSGTHRDDRAECRIGVGEATDYASRKRQPQIEPRVIGDRSQSERKQVQAVSDPKIVDVAQRHVAFGLGNMIEPAHFDLEDFVAAKDQLLVCAHWNRYGAIAVPGASCSPRMPEFRHKIGANAWR